jgi:hypothetical protein
VLLTPILSRQATRAVHVLGGMLWCVMVPPNGSVDGLLTVDGYYCRWLVADADGWLLLPMDSYYCRELRYVGQTLPLRKRRAWLAHIYSGADAAVLLPDIQPERLIPAVSALRISGVSPVYHRVYVRSLIFGCD